MSITTYAELQTAIGNWLNRSDSDTTSRAPEWIALAEGELRKDPRVRRLENQGTFSVDAETETLPTDCLALESLAHAGPTYYGPVEIVGPDMLYTLRGLYGASGVPRYAAVAEGALIFSPVPDATYSLKLVYWQGITPLASGVNWLLTSHPDIYLYASLIQASPYLKDPQMVPVWEQRLEKSLENLRLYNWNLQFGGGTVRRYPRPIGG